MQSCPAHLVCAGWVSTERHKQLKVGFCRDAICQRAVQSVHAVKVGALSHEPANILLECGRAALPGAAG